MSYFRLSAEISIDKNSADSRSFFTSILIVKSINQAPITNDFVGRNPTKINYEIGLGRVESIVAVQCCKCKNPVDCIKDGSVTTIIMPYCRDHLISQFNFYHKHTCFLYRDLNAQGEVLNPRVYIGLLRRTVFGSCPMCINCKKQTFVTDKNKDFVEGSIVIVGKLFNQCTIKYVKTTRCVK